MFLEDVLSFLGPGSDLFSSQLVSSSIEIAHVLHNVGKLFVDRKSS